MLIVSLLVTFYLKDKECIVSDEKESLLRQCQDAITEERAPTDFLKFALALRLLKAFDEEYKHESGIHYKDIDQGIHLKMKTCFKTLEEQLFPWISTKPSEVWEHTPKFSNIDTLKNSFIPGSRGIVICSCDRLFDFSTHLIKGIKAFSIDLPIVVAYIGDNDLSPAKQDYLNQLNVSALDVTKFFDDSILKMEGFAVKPFAILAAPFQEVMFLDADTVFIQNPVNFFSDPGYIRTGQLFQKDRALHHWYPKVKLWITDNIPQPFSETLLNTELWQGFTDYQMDSSFLIIDKHRCLYSLLAACKLNANEERKSFYTFYYGDKESFWLGAEMVNESYDFLPLLPGVFGDWLPGEHELLCGRQLMFDREGAPFYFNEAVVWDKTQTHDNRKLMDVPTYYSHHGRWYEPPHLRCIYTKGAKFTPQEKTRLHTVFNMYDHYDIN